MTSWNDEAVKAAKVIVAADQQADSKVDGAKPAMLASLKAAPSFVAWDLAIRSGLGLEHKVYDAAINDMVPIDGAKPTKTLAVMLSEAKRACRVLSMDQIAACQTWQDMKTAAKAADTKPEPEYAEKLKAARKRADSDPAKAESLAKALAAWLAAN